MSKGVPSLSESLAQAVALHQQGRLDQAEALYLDVLRLNPRQFDALHLLGVIAQQQGQPEKALVFINQAIAINPAVAAAHSNLGLALQDLKRPLEALVCYDRALALQPGYAEALYNRGNALQALGRQEEALACFGQALALKPDYAEAWFNQGKALHELKRLEEAVASYAQAARLRPEDAEAQFSRANVLLGLHRLKDAAEAYGQALKSRPGYVEALNNRGIALLQLGRLDEALADYDEVLGLKPDYVDALINRGGILLALGRPEGALACADEVLRLQPDAADALNNRGNALRDLNRMQDALASYTEALAVKPDFVEALNNQGNALQDLNRLEEALACYDKALLLRPDYADALNNRGNVLRRLDRHEEALLCFDQALRIKPDYAEALCNRGISLQAMRRFAEALADYAQAARIKPHLAEAHWNECMSLLSLGDFDRGFEKYEWRWGVKLFGLKRRDFKQAQWTGQEPLRGKTILLHAEQGFGDTIQFSRYVRQVAAAGAKVLLEVQPALKTLLAGLEGTNQVLARGESLPDFDCHCPLLSLPMAFKTGLDTIPAQTRYLRADPGIAAAWETRLGGKGAPRIGLAWSGNAVHSNDRNRSAPLADIIRLVSAARGQARFVSLQKEVRPADLAVLERREDIERLGETLGDFADTAGLVENLDLVVAVDTAVAHLAAALGKPVWLLLPFNADWRWLLDRSDSPWYPSVRLFRQRFVGDWGGVIAEAALALAQFLGLDTDEPPACLTVDEAFRQALALHQQGRRGEAQALYQAILRDDPGHAGALHLLGVSALEDGDAERGIGLIRRSLSLDPSQSSAHANLGAALRGLNRTEEALACFSEALKWKPDDAETHNNQGNALRDLNRPQEALASFERALALRPDYPEALCNRGNALLDLKRSDEALACYDQALRLRPDYVEVMNNRGNALQNLGRLEDALASLDQALRLRPDFVEALNNRGNTLLSLNRLQEGLECFDTALRLRPDYVEALNNRGNALIGLKRAEEALASFVRAGEISPGHVSVLVNRSIALLGLKRFEEAVAFSDEALRIMPDCPEALNNRGTALHELGRWEEALDCFAQAQRLKPDFAEAFYNSGVALHSFRRYEEALAYYDRALALKPDYAEAICNYGVTLQAMGRHGEALARYQQTLRITPQSAQVHWNESLIRLLLGDYGQGLEHYEWRWETEPFIKYRRDFSQPLWLGQESLQGKTILLHAEQGLGDTIQFCRYAKQVAATGATVLLEVQPALKSLLAGVEGASEVYAQGEPLPGFDCHCPLLSLPLAFQTRVDTIPAQSRYLRADPAITAAWQARLGGSAAPRIGLSWSGNPKHANDRNRSAPLAEFIRLLSAGGNARFISLQKQVRPDDLAVLQGCEDIERLGEELGDFADTAGLVENLDLVIAVDSSVAHLAGALGKPVWLLLPFDPDWRWLLHRNDSPWYPRARLFRQTFPGDWGGVIKETALALAQFLGQSTREPSVSLSSDAMFRQALTFHQQGRRGEAQTLYQAILQDDPGHADALHLLGVSALEDGEAERGIGLIRRSLSLNPRQAAAQANLGTALRKLHRPEEALACFAEALKCKPDDVESLNNQGNVLLDLERVEEALASYDQALRLKSDYAEACNNRGNALQFLGRLDEALASFDRALRIKPGFVEAYYNRGILLAEMRRREDAAQSFARALEIVPDYPYALGLKLFLRMQCCDWADYAKDSETVIHSVQSGRGAQLPFDFLAFSDSAADQLLCAKRFVADRFAAPRPDLTPSQPYGHDKIRLAYLSGDFREHALSFALAGLFEAHDKARFETTAISFGPPGEGDMRQRLRQAFDRFEDVRGLSDLEVARRIRALEIDIAIDLSGHTAGARAGILMHRPAPVQVNYMGYPGTLGGDHLDYIVADAQVIPDGQQACYAEQVVHLPDTYWVSDPKLAMPERIPSRAEAGLPKQGFVFCCFNNNYKITPAVFAVWMRLLGRVEGSVLWLFGGGGPVVEGNLRKEAARFGIAPERLVFAGHMPRREDHLARQHLADLFLDTLPYNAHATASDALWAGLPLLTCQGSAFAGRVAASLLRAIGLPELITENLQDYEALALKLATTPGLLDGIRAKLAENRKTYPVFDTDRFRRHLEAAYITMWERHQRGEPPVGFAVPPVA